MNQLWDTLKYNQNDKFLYWYILQVLAFNTPSACIQTHRHGLSGGSVLLIIFFIAFGVYFVGGIAILYFMRGARGLEAIPNIDFWRGLPGLVKVSVLSSFHFLHSKQICSRMAWSFCSVVVMQAPLRLQKLTIEFNVSFRLYLWLNIFFVWINL